MTPENAAFIAADLRELGHTATGTVTELHAAHMPTTAAQQRAAAWYALARAVENGLLNILTPDQPPCPCGCTSICRCGAHCRCRNCPTCDTTPLQTPPATRQKPLRAGDRIRVVNVLYHHDDEGVIVEPGPFSHEVLLDKDSHPEGAGTRFFQTEDLQHIPPRPDNRADCA